MFLVYLLSITIARRAFCAMVRLLLQLKRSALHEKNTITDFPSMQLNIVWCTLFGLMMIALYRDVSHRERGAIALFLGFMVLYVPLVGGTLAVARFRFACTPILFLFAMRGYTLLQKRSV